MTTATDPARDQACGSWERAISRRFRIQSMRRLRLQEDWGIPVGSTLQRTMDGTPLPAPETAPPPRRANPGHLRIATARRGGRSDFTSFQASPRAIGVGTPERTIPDRFVKPYRRHKENPHLRRNRQNTAWVIGSVGTTNATGLSMP